MSERRFMICGLERMDAAQRAEVIALAEAADRGDLDETPEELQRLEWRRERQLFALRARYGQAVSRG